MDGAPVFVKIDDYQDISDVVALMREKVSQAKALLGHIRELKSKEDAELSAWARNLDEVDARVLQIDRVLMEPRQDGR